MKKSFVITIDTESDNQWNVENVQSTKNSKYIPRFQELCEKYYFRPVYLVDYSMANDEFLVEYLSECVYRGACEIGMHLHAWDTPPFVSFDKKSENRPYLVEYPEEIMEAKIKTLNELLNAKFDCEIVSHRAGRWAMNDEYFSLLKKYGYKVDCSYTPGINWKKVTGSKEGGPNYSKVNKNAHFHKESGILEVPATVSRLNYFKNKSIREAVKFLVGRNVWLRPALFSNDEMKTLIEHNKSSISEFMMHSSELMPGGSPYFENEEAIEILYERLELFFAEMSTTHEGKTLQEIYNVFLKEPVKEE